MIYFSGESLTEDSDLALKLFNENRLVSKKIGLSKKSRQTKEFKQAPYLFDEYATAYIVENNLANVENADKQAIDLVLNSSEYKTFCKLRPQYYLLNGSKFGGLFLAYKNNPEKHHAEHIIFTEGSIIEISRLATIAKKSCIFVDPQSLKSFEVKYIPNVPRTS